MTIFLNATNQHRFEALSELTGHHHQMTVLLDRIIYWWQNSEIEIEGYTWTTRLLEQISTQTRIPLRTLERYLARMQSMNLIVKQCFKTKAKRLYIRVTETVLHALGYDHNKNPLNTSCEKPVKSTLSEENPVHNPVEKNFNSANLAESLYKEKERKNNNIVKDVLFFEKKETQKPALEIPNINLPVYPIENTMGEGIPEDVKQTAKIVVHQATEQGAVISSPQQVFAEVVFSLTNTAQFKGVDDTKHKINIIAKLLRENQWSTPRGFFNHADYANIFKPKDDKPATEKKPDAMILVVQKQQELSRELNNLYSDAKGIEQMMQFSKSSSEPLKIQLQEKQAKISGIDEELNALHNIHNPDLKDWVRHILGSKQSALETRCQEVNKALNQQAHLINNVDDSREALIQEQRNLKNQLAQYQAILNLLHQHAA